MLRWEYLNCSNYSVLNERNRVCTCSPRLLGEPFNVGYCADAYSGKMEGLCSFKKHSLGAVVERFSVMMAKEGVAVRDREGTGVAYS